jgi:hypothetical protein
MQLGDTTTSTTPAATIAPGFSDGLMMWTTPGTALTAVGNTFSNFSTAFSGANLAPTIGLLLPPLALLFILMGGSKR